MSKDPELSRSERRAQIVQGIVDQTGIDERMIHTLVHTFYGKVRQDDQLGPIFSRAMASRIFAASSAPSSTTCCPSARSSSQPVAAPLSIPRTPPRCLPTVPSRGSIARSIA